MTLTVYELPKAKQDKDSIFRWLHKRSSTGAASWLRAYDLLMERLRKDAQSCGEAPANADCELFVQQALFKPQRGRVYRVLFFLEVNEVYILRVRGPGQAPVSPEDIR